MPAPHTTPEPTTERSNPATQDLDRMSTLAMVQAINAEDMRVAKAVRCVLPHIAEAIDAIAARMRRGGRLIYAGAGTSGRLGVLDASECPPTFSTSPGLVVGVIAGGERALRQAVEGAEDDPAQARADLAALRLTGEDCVVGLSASGGAPYVIGALDYAQECGALTVAVACNPSAPIAAHAHIAILAEVGPEVIAGSTRLKAGTAQKMILNMLSTGVMVRLGKTYGNLMVDVQASNAKLRRRATRLVMQVCGLEEEPAGTLLERCDWQVKTAIAAHHLRCEAAEAHRALEQAGGMLREVIG